MPPHYAISEAFITLAALWCAWKLFHRGQWMGAIGSLLFGAAASIGVYRFPSGQVEELAHLHRMAGLLGGLVGMALIASEFLRSARPSQKRELALILSLTAVGISLVIAFAKPAVAIPLFLIWSILAIISAFSLPNASLLKRILCAACAGGMFLNVIFIRQSGFLDTHVSWHLFHTLTALWLIGVCISLKQTPWKQRSTDGVKPRLETP